MALLRGLAVAALLLGGGVAQQAAAPTSPAPVLRQQVDREQVERLLARHGVQTSLPDGGDEVGGGGDGAREPRGERSGAPARSREHGADFAMPLPGFVAELLLWTVVALAVALLAAAIVRGVRGRRAGAPAAKAVRARRVAAPPPAGDLPDAELPDHARFAAAGDFAAAVRALLRHAFAAWVRRGGALPVSATGREVLRLVRGRSVPVEPLAQLVTAVERVHFGGRAADRSLYDASREWLSQWEAACANRR